MWTKLVNLYFVRLPFLSNIHLLSLLFRSEKLCNIYSTKVNKYIWLITILVCSIFMIFFMLRCCWGQTENLSLLHCAREQEKTVFDSFSMFVTKFKRKWFLRTPPHNQCACRCHFSWIVTTSCMFDNIKLTKQFPIFAIFSWAYQAISGYM